MDGSDTFQRMAEIKDALIDDDDRDSNWVRESEVKERIEAARKDERDKIRDQWVAAVYKEVPRLAGGSLTYDELSMLSVVEVGPERVGQIVRRVGNGE